MASGELPAVRDGLAYRGKHWRIWLGNDGIVRCVIEGDHDKPSVETILEAFGELGQKLPERPFRVLFYAHRALRLTPEARDRFIEACRAHINVRVALVRASPLAKIQARAIARHSGRDFTFHDNEPDALKALGVAMAPTPPPPRAEQPPDVGVLDHIA